MNAADVSHNAVELAWDVMQALADSLKPWAIEDVCTRFGVPMIDLGGWPSTLESLRSEIAAGGMSDAERLARIVALIETLVNRVRELFDISSGNDALLWLRTMLTQAMLLLATEQDRNWLQQILVWVSAGLLLMDLRVQEGMLSSSPIHHTEQGVWPLLERYGTDEVKATIALIAAEFGVERLVGRLRRSTHLSPRRWRFGFDVPAYEPPPIDSDLPDPLAVAREAARWTFGVEYNLENIELVDARYDAFDLPAPVVEPFATGFRVAFVPVPASSRFDADDTSRPAMIHISLGGDVAETQHFGDSTLSVSVSGDAGILLPVPRMTWDWPWNWDWTPPGSFSEVTGGVEMAFQYATARRARADADPSGVSITVDRFVTEGRI